SSGTTMQLVIGNASGHAISTACRVRASCSGSAACAPTALNTVKRAMRDSDLRIPNLMIRLISRAGDVSRQHGDAVYVGSSNSIATRHPALYTTGPGRSIHPAGLV